MPQDLRGEALHLRVQRHGDREAGQQLNLLPGEAEPGDGGQHAQHHRGAQSQHNVI